jgi:ATP-dependent DNA helicase DinG
VEAGTGVGKSFAYLVPLLIHKKNRPAVVSTGTIALQEQLVQKDLPILARCLKRPIKIALAKGRQHYVCEHRFNRAYKHLIEAVDEREKITLDKMRAIMGRGILGRSNLPGHLSSETWNQIQSESGLCGHTVCRERPCSYTLARREMDGADIIVVNHSLLFVHLQLAKLGVSLLPQFTEVVLDEAHHSPDVATEQFGIHLSNTQVHYFCEQLHAEKKSKGFLSRLQPPPTLLQKKVVQLRGISEAFFTALKFWLEHEAPENGRVKKAYPFENPLGPALMELSELMENWAASSENSDEEREFRFHAQRALTIARETEIFIHQTLKDAAYWIETRERRQLHIEARAAPLNVAFTLKDLLFEKMDAVIMTSATISTSNKSGFDFFKRRMGAQQCDELTVASPFRYEQDALLWTSRQLPDPKEPEWVFGLTALIQQQIDLTAGGVFILTTSHQLLRMLFEDLLSWSQSKGYHLLAQGFSGERQALLESFKSHPKAILIGSSTFWEGVDVPGPSLRHVIIPRLPFEVPNHPLQESRAEQIEKRGGSPFAELALPQALIRFKQGFGRLIRNAEDLGMVSVLDSRLITKTYGRDFIHTLPPCPLITDDRPNAEFMSRLRKHFKSGKWSDAPS